MVTFEEMFARLPKEDQKRISRAINIETERIPTPSLGLNLALGGGLGMGRFVVFWGSKSAGKTAVALQTAAEAQKLKKSVAFVDAEGTFDAAWATRLGCDPNEIAHTPVRSVGAVTNTVASLIKAGTDIVIIDSITAITPSDYVEKGEFKGWDSMNRIGASAKDLGKMINAIHLVNEDYGAMIILIAQIRMGAVGGNQMGPIMPGGEAPKFMASQVIKLQASPGIKNFYTDTVWKGDVALERVVGRQVNWKVEFNKLGPQGGTGSWDFYYDGDKIGVDRLGEIADLGIEYCVLEKAGKWIKLGDKQWDGRSNFIAALQENPDLRKEIEGALNERLQTTTAGG
jgi:recombination protein RecA